MVWLRGLPLAALLAQTGDGAAGMGFKKHVEDGIMFIEVSNDPLAMTYQLQPGAIQGMDDGDSDGGRNASRSIVRKRGNKTHETLVSERQRRRVLFARGSMDH